MPDLYDTQYPGEVAGHVEAGAFITDDGLVRTSRGDDVLFTGAEVDREDPPRRMQHTGTESVNRDIGEAVKRGREKDERTPVVNVANSWQTGNVTLPDSVPVRILIKSPNRKSVDIVNQSNALMYIGRDSGLKSAGPNTCFLPPNSARSFTHTQEIWIVGTIGRADQIVDWVEENY